MNLHLFALIEGGVAASWLIVCIMVGLPLLLASPDIKGAWLKLGLRRTYYHLVNSAADDAFADRPIDLKQRRKVVDRLYDLFLLLNILAGLAMLALTAGWIFGSDASAANFGQGLLGWSRVMVTLDYILVGGTVLLICYWQSLNMIAGKRLKTMRKLVKVVSSISKQTALADYHQALRRTLIKIVNLPEQDFQLFWRQFNANSELSARLTVLQQVLQQDHLDLLLKQNADLAREVNATIQVLLAAMTGALNDLINIQHQAAEQSWEQQSQQLLNKFKAVSAPQK